MIHASEHTTSTNDEQTLCRIDAANEKKKLLLLLLAQHLYKQRGRRRPVRKPMPLAHLPSFPSKPILSLLDSAAPKKARVANHGVARAAPAPQPHSQKQIRKDI